MSGQDQELLQRQQPKDQKVEQVKFSNGGEDSGPPKSFFKSSFSSYSVVCRPDPENPGQQICQKTESTNSYDPFKGNQQRQRQSEEVRQIPATFNYYNKGGYPQTTFYEQHGSQPQNYHQNQKPNLMDRLLNFFDFGQDSYDHQNYYETKHHQTQDFFQQDQLDPFQIMEKMERSMLGNFGMMDGRFHDSPLDDFFRGISKIDEVFNDNRFQNEERFSSRQRPQFARPQRTQFSQSNDGNVYDV